jgi:hypothetical protein
LAIEHVPLWPTVDLVAAVAAENSQGRLANRTLELGPLPGGSEEVVATASFELEMGIGAAETIRSAS